MIMNHLYFEACQCQFSLKNNVLVIVIDVASYRYNNEPFVCQSSVSMPT